MSVIIDILLVLVLISCVWAGIRKGLVLGVAGLIVLLVAIVGANFIAKTYSKEFIPAVEPFISNFVDEAVNSLQLEGEDEAEPVEYRLDGETEEIVPEVYDAAMTSLKKLGISESSARTLAEKASKGVAKVGQSLTNSLADELCKTICYLMVFMIAFILIFIILTIIATILNLAFKLPGLNIVNDIGGGILGLAKGAVLVCAIACVLQYVGIAFPAGTLEKTTVLQFVMENNFIADMLGI